MLQKALLFVTEPGGLFQAMRYFGYGRVGKEVSVTKSGAFCQSSVTGVTVDEENYCPAT